MNINDLINTAAKAEDATRTPAQAIAHSLRVSESVVSKWIAGAPVPFRHIVALADLANINLSLAQANALRNGDEVEL